MKKVILVLALGMIGFNFVSCTKVEVHPNENENEDTTDLTLDLGLRSNLDGGTEGRPVNRDGVFDWVKSITVNVYNVLANETQSELYELVDDGSGDSGFVMNNVLLGDSEVSASTEPYDIDADHSIYLSNDVNELDLMKGNLPYVIYNSNVNLVTITNSSDDVSLHMTTQHGRRISQFQLANGLGNNFRLRVVSSVGEVTTTEAGEHVYSYWSNENALGGAERDFLIEVIHSGNGNVMRTYNVSETVAESTSTTTIFTVSMNDIEREEQGFLFTWQEWTGE